MFNMHPFKPTAEAYARMVEIHNALWPDDLHSVTYIKYHDAQRNPKYFFQRWMIELDDPSSDWHGKIIAVGWAGEPAWSYRPGKYFFGFHVDPALSYLEYGENSLSSTYMNHIITTLQAREPKLTILTTDTREDKSERIAYLQALGFEQMMRYPESALEVTNFDPTPFRAAEEKAASNGIKIYTLSELKTKYEDWVERQYDLDIAILTDIPSPDIFTPQPIEEFAKIFSHPGLLEEAWFVAIDGDDYVGLSNLWDNEANPDKLYVGLTGVRRSHRRQGIATALKLKTIAYAQKVGAKYIATDNEENNPMYQLNLALGFKPLPAWLDFQKKLVL